MATRLIFFYRFCTELSIKFAIDANFFGDRRIIGRNRFQKCFNLYECKKMLQDFNTNWYLHMHPAPSVLISLLNPKKSIKNNIFWTLIFNCKKARSMSLMTLNAFLTHFLVLCDGNFLQEKKRAQFH